MIGEGKKLNNCDYPMCSAAKDAAIEDERHKELRKDLSDIKMNQANLAEGLQQAVIKLEKIALLSLEIGHLRTDLDGLGNKLRGLERDVWVEINGLKKERVTWLQQVIAVIIGGVLSGIGVFTLAKLWPHIGG